MSDNQVEQENVYKMYSIRSEHALSVTASTNHCDSCKCDYRCNCTHNNYFNDNKRASLWIEGELWEFTYETKFSYRGHDEELKLRMRDSMTAAEIIFWYWNDKKEIAILHQKVYDNFYSVSEKASQLPWPINMNYNAVIRLLDKRNENENNGLLESYYGDFGVGIEKVTLHIIGTNKEVEASFTVPKLDLVRASPVFYRMLTAEMTEKATGEVKIEDTNAEEFGDFLKAISPKQELPNPHNVRTLLKLADRYECQSLIDRCEAHLMNCIEIPMVERINIADSYGLKGLKENLLMHLKGTGILELYQDAKPHRNFHKTLDKLFK